MHGTPDALPERIRQKITVDPATDCWIWTASRDSLGYGRVKWDRRSVASHRLTYHLLADPSLELWPGRGCALVADHLCRVPACVNPAHIEIVSQRENQIRGEHVMLGHGESRFVGVTRRFDAWRATINMAGRQVYLGRYPTEKAAAAAYDAAAAVVYADATNFRLGMLAAPPAGIAIDVARARIERSIPITLFVDCPGCGGWFTPRRASHRWCSEKCRMRGHASR